ncbi:MAG: hypothetical protein [Caudoviricetes sp.]|nr:MAG: hypothetical protein [Caudoviricetes sp.]
MAGQDDEFIQILRSSSREIAESAKSAIDWFKGKVTDLIKKVKTPNQVFSKDATPSIGQMYMFVYDAKHKDTLPFYDMYPLVFPIEFYGDGFLGINLHYLPPLARAALLNNLKKLANNNKYDDSTKLAISYEVLKAHAMRFKGFENCIKRYLFSHVRSSFHQVSSSDWDKAVLLPLQRWHVNPNKKYAKNPPY